MEWNYNMDEAKKSIKTTTTRKGKNGPIEVPTSTPFYILVSFEKKNGNIVVTKSHWMEDQSRWEMFTGDPEHTQPFAFIPWDVLVSHPNRSE